jgi:hypothetical protein
MNMKKQLTILLIMALAFPVLAQETNEFKHHGEERGPGRKNHDRPEFNKRPDRPESTEEQRKERRYQFMNKALSDIGVSDEDKIKIRQLQDQHREKMKLNSERTNIARKKLSDAQEASADEAQIDAAIDEITKAQGQQLKILVRNRMEMEKILGKEKYGRFMDSARNQFRQHDRRGGAGMPPRPGMYKKRSGKNPPLPESPPKQETPPVPEK